MPTTSPGETRSETSSTRLTPGAAGIRRPDTSSTGSPETASRGLTAGTSPRPIIASTISPAVVCAVASRAVTTPSRRTVTRSVASSTSRTLWVTRATVVPCPAIRRTTANSLSTSPGVRTAVGSSRISTSACRCSALRISTRWRTPSGSVSTRAVGSTSRPIRAESSSTRSLGGPPVQQPEPRRLRAVDDVLGHGQRAEEPEVLVHHAQPRGDRVERGGQPHLAAVAQHLAGVGPVQAVEDRHQGGLARAVLPDDGVHGPAVEDQVHAVDREDGTEPLGDAAQLGRGGRPRGRAGRRAAGHPAAGSSTVIVPSMMSCRTCSSCSMTSGRSAIRQPESATSSANAVRPTPSSARP